MATDTRTDTYRSRCRQPGRLWLGGASQRKWVWSQNLVLRHTPLLSWCDTAAPVSLPFDDVRRLLCGAMSRPAPAKSTQQSAALYNNSTLNSRHSASSIGSGWGDLRMRKERATIKTLLTDTKRGAQRSAKVEESADTISWNQSAVKARNKHNSKRIKPILV